MENRVKQLTMEFIIRDLFEGNRNTRQHFKSKSRYAKKEIITKLYQRYDLSQIEIADICGLSRGAISQRIKHLNKAKREIKIPNLPEPTLKLVGDTMNKMLAKRRACEVALKVLLDGVDVEDAIHFAFHETGVEIKVEDLKAIQDRLHTILSYDLE